MAFEEEFPSLKDRIQEAKDVRPKHTDVVSAFSVNTHCLDKARVKEAIDKALKKLYRADIEKVLLKELGL